MSVEALWKQGGPSEREEPLSGSRVTLDQLQWITKHSETELHLADLSYQKKMKRWTSELPKHYYRAIDVVTTIFQAYIEP